MADKSTDQNQNNEGAKPDSAIEIKNLKSEFSRKQENLMSELTQIKQLLAESSKSAINNRHKVVEQAEDEVPDPILEPKKYKEYLKREVMNETSQMVNQNNQRNAQLSALVQSYPELQSSDSDLTKRAVEYYSRLSEYEKQSPNAYKYAVQDAASELGVLPVNKRPKSSNQEADESFTANSGSYNSNRPSAKKKTDDKIDDATLAFAQAIGKDINDPKYIESLKKYTGRKNWNKGQ